MSTSGSARRSTETKTTRWLGFILFAGIMMIMLGVFHAVTGLVALFRDEVYLVRSDGLIISLDYTSWAWIHLLIGLVVMFAGVALLRGRVWARVVAVVVAGLSAVASLAFLYANPIWGAIIIAVDILVIYAVTVHGREVGK